MMNQLRLLTVLGMLLVASSVLAQTPLYTATWTTEDLYDSFLVTVTIEQSLPDLEFRVYRDLLLPQQDPTIHHFTDGPVPAPVNGGSLVISYNNLDMNPYASYNTTGRFVIEAIWPDGSIAMSESILLSWDENYLVARGYLIEDYLIDPCTGIFLMECTNVELLYGEMQAYVGTGEMLNFYGHISDYNGMDDCSLQITGIQSLGLGAPCEEPVANNNTSWGGLKATYR